MQTIQMRDAFIDICYAIAREDSNFFFLSCEYGAPALDRYRKDLPGQFFNMGIAEQNAISVAAGMALEGKKVVVYSIASFITLRCLEQVKIDLCAMALPVTIVGVGPCFAYGVDGPTHHATEDISIMSSLASMTIFSASDHQMAAELATVSLDINGPVYCRLDKGYYECLPKCDAEDWERGFRYVGQGSDAALIATGNMVHRAVDVARHLETHGIRASVIDLFRPKPLDGKQIVSAMQRFPYVFCVEEHSTYGGIGSILGTLIAQSDYPTKFRHLAVDDNHLYTYGERSNLHKTCRLDSDAIVRTVVQTLRSPVQEIA